MRFPVGEILARRLRSRLVQGGALVLAANGLSGAMNLAAIILTIRHLPPEAFGVLTVGLTTMQLVAMLSNAGLNETLMTMVSRAEAAQRRDAIAQSLSMILCLRLIVAVLVVTAGVLLARPIAESIFRQPALAFALSAGVIGGSGVSLYQFGLTALQASRAYARYALSEVVRFGSILGALSLLAVTGHLNLQNAMIANAAAPFLAFSVTLSLGAARTLRHGRNPFQLLPQIWHMSKWVSLAGLCNMFLGRFQIYFLTAFAPPAEVGTYGAAFKLCGALLLLETATRTVLFPEVSRRAGSSELGSFVRRSLPPLAIFGAIVWGISLVASPLIPLLLGERYASAAPIFLILVAARAPLIPLVPLSLLFFATDSTRAGAWAAMVQLAVLVGGSLLLIPSFGARGAAWTEVLVTGAAFVYLLIFARPYLETSTRPIRASAPNN